MRERVVGRGDVGVTRRCARDGNGLGVDASVRALARGFFAGTGEDPLGTGGARDDDPRWSVGVVGDWGGRRGRARGRGGHRRKRREVGIVDRLADAFRRGKDARARRRAWRRPRARGIRAPFERTKRPGVQIGMVVAR